MLTTDPFEQGMISIEDVKNAFCEGVRAAEFLLKDGRSDLALEKFEDVKYKLLDRAVLNGKLFKCVPRSK